MILIFLLIIIILLFILFSPNAVYFIHKNHFEWKNKEKNKIKKEDYWIDYYPIAKKYVAVYKGQYPFFLYSWSLHSSPSDSFMFDTKEKAIKHLNLYLEQKGIGKIKIEI